MTLARQQLVVSLSDGVADEVALARRELLALAERQMAACFKPYEKEGDEG